MLILIDAFKVIGHIYESYMTERMNFVLLILRCTVQFCTCYLLNHSPGEIQDDFNSRTKGDSKLYDTETEYGVIKDQYVNIDLHCLNHC